MIKEKVTLTVSTRSKLGFTLIFSSLEQGFDIFS